MSNYIYSGQALGAAAHFHRLDDVENLNHLIPTLGASVLAPTGGASESHIKDYAYKVDHPRHRTLVSIRKIDTAVTGKETEAGFETDVNADVIDIDVLEKLHIDSVRLHFFASRPVEPDDAVPTVTTKGSHVAGIRMGAVTATVTLDEEPLTHCGTAQQLGDFYRAQSEEYKKEHGWRYHLDVHGSADPHPHHHRFTLVKGIQLSGPETELQSISLERTNVIRWKGFGRIFLGEVEVKGNERRVTLVRLAMGSDGGGSGTAGSGSSNGQTG